LYQPKPDVIWVGLGSPKQEFWMVVHRDQLNAPIIIGMGATFDFNAGSKKRAPARIQIAGFEWLFRFLNEPNRL
jgi:N-acetylglucosaminyldiphosphoundecaprenol N-acetyl-beta-D-mannosaminyltransferase